MLVGIDKTQDLHTGHYHTTNMAIKNTAHSRFMKYCFEHHLISATPIRCVCKNRWELDIGTDVARDDQPWWRRYFSVEENYLLHFSGSSGWYFGVTIITGNSLLASPNWCKHRECAIRVVWNDTFLSSITFFYMYILIFS